MNPQTTRSSKANFLTMWLGQGVSEFGSQISMLAIPTLAILIYHATPFQASVIGALEVAPFTLFALPSGPLADRLPRRAVLIACDIGRFAAIGTLTVTYLAGFHLMWIVYVVAFVVGTFTVFFDVTYMSFVPHVVAPDQLISANSKLGGTASVARTVGPGLGGLLFQAVGPARTIAFDAVSYLVSVLALVFVRVKEPERTNKSKFRLGSLVTEIREGLVFVRRSPVLARIALVNAVCDFGQAIIQAVYFVFLYNSLHLRPGPVGFLIAIPGVAFTLGTMLLPRITRRFGLGPTMAYSVFVGMGIELFTPFTLLGFAAVILIVINVVAGATNAFYDINQLTYRQKYTPDEIQGRVHATMRMAFSGPRPFGYLLGGVLGTYLGVTATVFVGALVATLGASLLFSSAVLRLRSLDDIERAPGQDVRPTTKAEVS